MFINKTIKINKKCNLLLGNSSYIEISKTRLTNRITNVSCGYCDKNYICEKTKTKCKYIE